jgi:hypothetical protein
MGNLSLANGQPCGEVQMWQQISIELLDKLLGKSEHASFKLEGDTCISKWHM